MDAVCRRSATRQGFAMESLDLSKIGKASIGPPNAFQLCRANARIGFCLLDVMEKEQALETMLPPFGE